MKKYKNINYLIKEESMHFKYLAQKYNQGNSDLELFSFCAKSTEIKKWGGVPTKAAIFHGGFQRALSPRFKKIVKYFNDGQASPTSIVVAFRLSMLKVEILQYPDNSWPAKDTFTSLPEIAFVSFDVDETLDSAPIEILCQKVSDLLKPRLEKSSVSDKSSDDINEPELETDPIKKIEEDQSLGEEDSDDNDEDFDVGHSKLKNFYAFINDPIKVNEFINKSLSDDENLKNTEELKGMLISLLRPAMIVDGQHRIFGAYESEKASEIIFTVNAIRDADWVEQVFQFVVLNKLAKPISPLFLTSLLNTSLTNDEVKNIEVRLINIGIKNTDRIIMKFLNHDENSPFYNQITEPGEMLGTNNHGRLPDKGMIALAKRWKAISGEKKEIQMFQKSIEAKNITQAKEKWKKYPLWLSYFYAFWDTLKIKYKAQSVWEKADGYFLLYMVTMTVMQDLFIVSKSKGDSRFDSIDDFKNQVNLFFEDVPAVFFQGWKRTGNQTDQGMKIIKAALESLRGGMRLKTIQEESELFKEAGK